MCGIIGYIGNEERLNITLDGLKALEYRGYDSAGLAFINKKGNIQSVKTVGHVEALIKKVNGKEITKKAESASIAHTRWATHGGVTELNAHPHISNDGKFAVVHNGIIENHKEIIEFLKSIGITMKSETDTEVIPNLIQYYYNGDLLVAVRKTIAHLQGSYSFLILTSHEPDTLICAKYGSMPLTIGQDSDLVFITSDIPTALTKTETVFVMEDGEIAVARKNLIRFFQGTKIVTKQPIKKNENSEPITKLGFSTFMEKEINDIPSVLMRITEHYEKHPYTDTMSLIHRAETVHIVACGTAHHAGLILGSLLEKHCRIRAKNYVASEFIYQDPFIANGDVGVVISQSGETADTITALQLMKKVGIKTIAICNTENSTIARISDFVLPTLAGFEFAVASTKAYCAQSLVSAIIVNEIFRIRNGINFFSPKELKKLPAFAQEIIANRGTIKKLAADNADAARIFFIGKDLDSITCMESALKVKEITYGHCEGYAAGELKHGTLSLVDKNTLTVVYRTNPKLITKIDNAISEVRARDSRIIIVDVPASPLAFCYSVINAQFLALYLCQLKGYDPDKPRNLAKSVTVE